LGQFAVLGPTKHGKAGGVTTRPFTLVFVLTHHARTPLAMDDRGIEATLKKAFAAAGGKDVLGGGVATIQQYRRVGLIDEMYIAISPVLLGSGEKLFDDLDLANLGYKCRQRVTSPAATHVVVVKNK
jgi:dihydrofolate reductase